MEDSEEPTKQAGLEKLPIGSRGKANRIGAPHLLCMAFSFGVFSSSQCRVTVTEPEGKVSVLRASDHQTTGTRQSFREEEISER